MKYNYKKTYFILFFIIILFFWTGAFSKNSNIKFSKDNVSNYLAGIISANQDYTSEAFKYFNKVQPLKNSQSNYNIQFIQTLVLLEKFEEAFNFSKEIWKSDELFFEADLLLGLQSIINKKYLDAEKYFQRLNEVYGYNFLLDDFIGNFLISISKAAQNNKASSFKYFNKIPERYYNLKQIQNSFLQCYFDTNKTETAFKQVIQREDAGFSRYNFFLANYYLSKNKNDAAQRVINESKILYGSNLLIKQSEIFILNGKNNKIINFFNCNRPEDIIAEIFYVIANLYSSQENYKLSNFYLKISLFLNNKFTLNKALLAENYYKSKQYDLAKFFYNSMKSIGSVYSWHASINLAKILSLETNVKKSISALEKEFNLLQDPNFEHYYDLANFFKDNEYYEESIKYYSLALQNIKQDNLLVAKILDRRGTSYERLGKWKKAEKDLLESLKILPDQPYVLNYLAYSWTEKKININKVLGMLKRATELREDDGYIIDSLGWAHYANKNYVDAEKFLKRAVELMPLDPIINDHYGDALWMLNKNIQARYFWQHAQNLDATEEKLKDNVSKKLIFGIDKKL